MNIPQAPLSAEINSLHKTVKDLISYVTWQANNGLRYKQFTGDQIDSMLGALTDASNPGQNIGKIVYNTTNDKPTLIKKDGNNVVKQEL